MLSILLSRVRSARTSDVDAQCVCLALTPEEKKAKKQEAASSQDEAEVVVSRLDLRVGRIISALPLPGSDSLYVTQVNVGEALPRTVVSKLVKQVPVDVRLLVICDILYLLY